MPMKPLGILISFLCLPVASAQFTGNVWPAEKGIDEPVDDAFNIGFLTYVYRYSKLTDDEGLGDDLSDLPAVTKAVQLGLPGPDQTKLFHFALGHPHDPVFRAATAKPASKGYVWDLKWSLMFRGSSSGVPWEYRVVVEADGTVRPHEIFLTDCQYDFGDDEAIFSTLALRHLVPKSQSKVITAEQATGIAKQAVKDALDDGRIKQAMRFWKMERFEVPLPRHLQKAGRRSATVFLARFDRSLRNLEKQRGIDSFNIWVSAEGTASTISRDRWSIGRKTSKR